MKEMCQNLPFIDYWNSIDQAMIVLLAIDTCDAGIEPHLIAAAQEAGETPEEFAYWFGEKYGLTTLTEWRAKRSSESWKELVKRILLKRGDIE